MKHFLSNSLPAFFILLVLYTNAQVYPCSYWPAPCPNTTSIEQSNDVSQRKTNAAIDESLAFQKKLRGQLTDLLKKVAKQNDWEVYELMEDFYDGPPFQFTSYDAWRKTPYEKRPPVWDDLAFIIIVNKDSLAQWRKWYHDFLSQSEKGTDEYMANVKKAGDDALLKSYLDSANYYSQLQTKYLEEHQQQYLQDLMSNNKTGIQEHERAQKSYTDKYSGYIKKYQNRQAVLYSGASQNINATESLRARMTATFTEGSLVLIHFGINPYHVTTGMQDGGQHSLVPQYSLKVAHASYAGLLINKSTPDIHAYQFNYKGYYFNSPASIATILLGNYQPKDSYNNWRPMFEKPFTSSVATLNSVKTIKCDVLQNLSIHIEGREDQVKNVITKMDWNSINALMGKNSL